MGAWWRSAFRRSKLLQNKFRLQRPNAQLHQSSASRRQASRFFGFLFCSTNGASDGDIVVVHRAHGLCAQRSVAPAGGTVSAGLNVQVRVVPLATPSTVNSLELREVVGSSYVARAYLACPVTYEPGSSTPDNEPCLQSIAGQLTAGTHELYVHAGTVGAAMPGDSQHVFVTVTGNSAPTVSVSSPANGTRILTNSGSASLTVTASGADVDNNLVSVSASVDGAAASLTGASSINSSIALAVGHHTISVTSKDAAGATATSNIGVDIVADAAPTATLQLSCERHKFPRGRHRFRSRHGQ